MQKRGFHPTFLLFEGTYVAEKRNQDDPLKSMSATERKRSSAPQRERHLCHLTSALSLQQDSVRLRRCGSRRHLRGRIALQANLSLQPTNPGLQPEVTHSIAFQAKIVLLPTGWKANFNRVRS